MMFSELLKTLKRIKFLIVISLDYILARPRALKERFKAKFNEVLTPFVVKANDELNESIEKAGYMPAWIEIMQKVTWRQVQIENVFRRLLGLKLLVYPPEDKKLEAWDFVEEAWWICYSLSAWYAFCTGVPALSRLLWRIYDNWPPGGFF